MADEETGLAALGIELVTAESDPRAHTECIRIARRLHLYGRKVIGLVPADPEVAIPPLAVQMGLALVEISGATVAFVDANVRWPAISELASGERRGEDESIFATRWLKGSLALLTPPRAGDPGAGVPQLRRLISHGAELFAHVLCDLTGFDVLGEHLGAIALCDGVIVVARAGRSRERALLELEWSLPPDANLGVILVG